MSSTSQAILALRDWTARLFDADGNAIKVIEPEKFYMINFDEKFLKAQFPAAGTYWFVYNDNDGSSGAELLVIKDCTYGRWFWKRSGLHVAYFENLSDPTPDAIIARCERQTEQLNELYPPMHENVKQAILEIVQPRV